MPTTTSNMLTRLQKKTDTTNPVVIIDKFPESYVILEDDTNRTLTATKFSFLFEDTLFYACFRNSLYAAQTECAMGEIYRLLLGYYPDIKTESRSREDGELYIVNISRSYKNFKTWSDAYNGNLLLNHQITDEGYMIDNEGEKKPLMHMASMSVILYFFACTDVYGSNYGVSEQDDAIYACKFDDEASLDTEKLMQDVQFDDLDALPKIKDDENGVGNLNIPPNIISSSYFQQEKMEMIKKIAATPFATFEEIFRRHITSNFLDEQKKMFKRLYTHGEIEESLYTETMKMFESDSLLEEYQPPLEMAIERLKIRYNQLINFVLLRTNNVEPEGGKTEEPLFSCSS